MLKDLRSLKTSTKARKDQGKTILEGIHLVESYLHAGLSPEYCVISESSVENDEVQAILDTCDAKGIRYVSVSDGQFKLISSVDNGIGLAAVITIPVSTSIPILEHNSLLVEGVQDPSNLGAILRTAAAAGVAHIYCSTETTSAWSPKALRVGMGAQFTIHIYEDSDLVSCVANSKIPVYATALDATDTLYASDLTGPCAWIMGNEGRGISKELLALSLNKITIPQSSGVESLNVAAAAAVCLFEQRRQQLSVGIEKDL